MKVITAVDPFTYAVHGFKQLILKNTGLAAIGGDLVYLALFTLISITAATLLFRRTLSNVPCADALGGVGLFHFRHARLACPEARSHFQTAFVHDRKHATYKPRPLLR
jgi:hypothetical protein